MRNALIRLIDTLELDALIFPFSLKGPWRWDNATQKGKEETALAAHTRLPAIVVPAGYISGDRADRLRIYWQAIQRFNATSGSAFIRENLSYPSRTELDPVVSKKLRSDEAQAQTANHLGA